MNIENTSGELTDYMVEENSAVDFGANGKKFLVRKGLSEDQLAELRAAGIAIEEEGINKSLTLKEITNAVVETIKSVLTTKKQKGLQDMDPNTEQQGTNVVDSAEDNDENKVLSKGLSDEDWAKVDGIIAEKCEAKLTQLEKSFEAYEARFQTLEKSHQDVQKSAEAVKATVAGNEQTTADLAKSLAQQTELISKAFNSRPAGAPPASEDSVVAQGPNKWAGTTVNKMFKGN